MPEHLVTATVAVLVVYLLEVVEVAEDHPEAHAVACGVVLLAGVELVEARAIPQLSQRVEQGAALFAVDIAAQFCARWLTLRSWM